MPTSSRAEYWRASPSPSTEPGIDLSCRSSAGAEVENKKKKSASNNDALKEDGRAIAQNMTADQALAADMFKVLSTSCAASGRLPWTAQLRGSSSC
jgi:hypothetical protein